MIDKPTNAEISSDSVSYFREGGDTASPAPATPASKPIDRNPTQVARDLLKKLGYGDALSAKHHAKVPKVVRGYFKNQAGYKTPPVSPHGLAIYGTFCYIILYCIVQW